MITLRDYQTECLEAITDAKSKGIHKPLVCLPTSSGKTVIFASLAKQSNCPTLILAHRDELIEQAIDKLQMIWPDVDCGVVKAERNEMNHQVIVASVQTLSRKRRLNDLSKDIGLIITDECFSYGTTVMLANGTKKPIGWLVHHRFNGEVLSYNVDENKIEPRHITDWYCHKPVHPIMRVKLDDRNQSIMCTANHSFWTPDGLKEAIDLQTGDLILTRPRGGRFKVPSLLGKNQKQVVLGSLLGDASIAQNSATHKGRLRFVHSNKQKAYLAYKISVLQSFFPTQPYWSKTEFSPEDGVWSINSISAIEFYQLKHLCYPDGKRQPSQEWLNQIDVYGLSFFYMDNGSLIYHKQSGSYITRFHTEGFNKESVILCANWLKERWDLNSHIVSSKGKYWV